MGHLYRSSLLPATLTLLLLPSAVLAQVTAAKPAEKAAPYTIHKVVFHGETPYSQAALEAASGLKPGSSLTTAGLQAAAEKVMATGAFGDISATLDGPVKSVDVVFTVKAIDAQHMLRASFDNFVWFTSDELSAGVQKRVPLFNGSIPEGGNVQDAVQDALQQMLAEKGVKATVVSELVAPHPGQPLRLAEYRVTVPNVRIHVLDLSGVPPAFADTTNKVVHSLIGSEYNDGLVDGLSFRVLSAYRNAGYLDAALGGLRSTIASSTPTTVEVDVTAKLQPGEPYKISKLEWAGSPLMSAEAFTAAAKVHPGDVASQEGVRASVENLDSVYRDHGYMDVVVDAVPKADAVSHQVAYTVTVIPGPQYKLRQLTVQNLTPEQRKDFDRGWRLKTGDVYDAGYVTSFLKNNTALLTLSKLAASFKVTEEPDSDVLDLVITFRKDPTK